MCGFMWAQQMIIFIHWADPSMFRSQRSGLCVKTMLLIEALRYIASMQLVKSAGHTYTGQYLLTRSLLAFSWGSDTIPDASINNIVLHTDLHF